MPGALKVFADGLNMTTAELFEAMEAGELVASEVLPKVAKQMSLVARQNNALEKGLKTSRSQWTMFVSQFKLLFDGFGSRKLDSGLASIIQALSIFSKYIKPVAQVLFWAIGLLMNLVGKIGKAFLFSLKPVFNIIDDIGEWFKSLGIDTDKIGSVFSDVVDKLLFLINPLTYTVMLFTGLIEEFVNLFTGARQGLFSGEGDTFQERIANGTLYKEHVSGKIRNMIGPSEAYAPRGSIVNKNAGNSLPNTSVRSQRNVNLQVNVAGQEVLNQAIDLRMDTIIQGAQ